MMVWRNGDLEPWDEDTVRMAVRGTKSECPIREGFRAYGGPENTTLFRLRDHVGRFLARARGDRLGVPYAPEDLAEACREVVRVNSLVNANIRMGLRWTVNGSVSIQVAVAAHLEPMEKVIPERAIDLRLAEDPCSARSGVSLFVVQHGVIHATPPRGLPVVARDTVVTLARQLGYQVRERSLCEDSLAAADEVFVAGVADEILPVASVNGFPAGRGVRGPMTAALQEKFLGLFRGKTEEGWGWLEPVDLWPPGHYAEAVA
jgi:branched-chain amino acid aminotransferase